MKTLTKILGVGGLLAALGAGCNFPDNSQHGKATAGDIALQAGISEVNVLDQPRDLFRINNHPCNDNEKLYLMTGVASGKAVKGVVCYNPDLPLTSQTPTVYVSKFLIGGQ